MIDDHNIRKAIQRAAKNKHDKRAVRKCLKNIDEVVKQIKEILVSGSFNTSNYKTKTIYEPKKRLIYILPFFPDRIVHHVVMNILEPIWDDLFYEHSYSCRKNKGQHKASKYLMKKIKKYKYFFKGDVSKFYPSINHEILKSIILKRITDKRVINILFNIIDSIEGLTNVPIGNYVSQWFGNLYLNELDLFIKHELKCKVYVRYSDDFVILSNDKKYLSYVKFEIGRFLESKLALRFSKAEVHSINQGIDFLGYRHFPGYVLVRKNTVKREMRTIKKLPKLYKLGVLSTEQVKSTICSIEGWISHANSYNLSKKMGISELKARCEKK